MASSRFRLSDAPPLYWDGHALRGATEARAVAVAVPARLVSFRREEFPPAAEPALKAAARMRGERAFAPLGPVAIEALFDPPGAGRRAALLLAVPRTTLEAIRKAVVAQGRTLVAVRVAELLAPVPAGGLVEVEGEACLVAFADAAGAGPRAGQAGVRAVAALGPASAPGFAQRVERERLRLGLAAEAAAAPPPGAGLDFLHPSLDAPPPLLARPGVRLALLGGGVAALALLAVALVVSDAVAERDEAHAAAERLRPLAKTLGARRADMKEVAAWFEARPSLAPALHALSQALPTAGSDDQVRLSRVRQAAGEESVAEGVAADRAQMLAYLGRLRADPRVDFAEIRSFRSPAKGSSEVVFELGFRLGATAAASRAPAPPAAPAAPAPATPAQQGGADAGA